MVAISAVSAGLTSLVQDLHKIPDEKIIPHMTNATILT
jgi:hypothetical protein